MTDRSEKSMKRRQRNAKQTGVRIVLHCLPLKYRQYSFESALPDTHIGRNLATSDSMNTL